MAPGWGYLLTMYVHIQNRSGWVKHWFFDASRHSTLVSYVKHINIIKPWPFWCGLNISRSIELCVCVINKKYASVQGRVGREGVKLSQIFVYILNALPHTKQNNENRYRNNDIILLLQNIQNRCCFNICLKYHILRGTSLKCLCS